jgi:hypothetical protein
MENPFLSKDFIVRATAAFSFLLGVISLSIFSAESKSAFTKIETKLGAVRSWPPSEKDFSHSERVWPGVVVGKEEQTLLLPNNEYENDGYERVDFESVGETVSCPFPNCELVEFVRSSIENFLTNASYNVFPEYIRSLVNLIFGYGYLEYEELEKIITYWMMKFAAYENCNICLELLIFLNELILMESGCYQYDDLETPLAVIFSGIEQEYRLELLNEHTEFVTSATAILKEFSTQEDQ